MTRTKQINSIKIREQEHQKKTFTDENGEFWIETLPGNWISLNKYESQQEEYRLEREEKEKLKKINCLTVPQLKQKLKNLGIPTNGRKAVLVKRLCTTV